ncbi:hypothetical protein [Psychrosphaera haliotis]|uniref:LRAT domain-containing protein n=1 Tax=Psychrosphaera haliotis TaxID=555083 RepID=A0A6N8F5B5_9GAMM|nr:hypothetical protein [Psychrosphaera haliotis]MDB2373604.1 hypothetical protein [Psychrosphaera haliotis]MUH71745.1 hypothetical protein [Psychrosphaera haliotis]
MPLPIIVAGLVLGAVVSNQSTKQYYRNLELRRNRESSNNLSNSNKLVKSPSEYCQRANTFNPEEGSIVCCEVFGVLDHTGVWIDEETIIEFSNTGLTKSVSASRFLKERSGNNIYVANNRNGKSIIIDGIVERAISRIYTYKDYDLQRNNCHNFIASCISTKNKGVTLFSDLNSLIAQISKQDIYWDKVKV